MSTEHQLVRLDVPREWEPESSRYSAGGYRSITRREKAFLYDDDAFPRFKPEFSVFYGSLSPSRKERGWYRVMRWPQTASASHLGPLRTGADLPPELVQHIINQLTPRDLWVKVQKRDLNTCALVCRHWARICRPVIFRALNLRDRNDVVSLISFVQSPISIIRDYLHTIRLMPNAEDRPWVHLLSTSLYPLLLPYQVMLISLTLEGPLSSSLPSIRTIHPMLPRSPASLSTRIAYLALRNIHFSRINSLMHLVWELPDLTYFIGEQLTWPQITPAVPQGWLRRTSRRPSVSVTLERCSDYWIAVWLAEVQVINYADNSRLRLFSNDRARLATLVDTVASCFSNLLSVKVTPGVRIYDSSRAWRELSTFTCVCAARILTHGSRPAAAQVSFHTADNYRVDPVLELLVVAGDASPGSSGTLRLQTLNLHVKPFEAVSRLDWVRFDKTASAFPDIQKVTIEFDSFADLDKFSDEHLDQKLLQLDLAGKLCLEGVHISPEVHISPDDYQGDDDMD